MGSPEYGLEKINKVDVVLVSWLVHPDHLSWENDFYFGPLQSLLAERGLSSLLVLGNQTDRLAVEMAAEAFREGKKARLLLPDFMSAADELILVGRYFLERRRLQKEAKRAENPLEKMVGFEAARTGPGETIFNMRRHAQMCRIFQRTKPRLAAALYEGHVWERMVWHAAKSTLRAVRCLGYQHTILRRHAHAIRRPLGTDSGYDPDSVFCLGDVTRRDLALTTGLGKSRVLTYGTHRCPKPGDSAEAPSARDGVLVLPEGLEDECATLYDFALEAARRMPDVPFIFRNHPVLPYERIKRLLKNPEPIPLNVEISQGRAIEDDYARCRFLLYRGSSTVIYSILAGLRPFYLERAGEVDIDPIYSLKNWRERIRSVEDLEQAYRRDMKEDPRIRTRAWRAASDYCRQYVMPIQPLALNKVLNEVFHKSAFSKDNYQI